MNNVIQLEAFESPLKARRICWFLPQGAPAVLPPGFQEQLYTESPQYQRKILITSHHASEAWKLAERWDAILLPQTQTDWSVALAVMTNAQQPALIVSTPDIRIPAAVFQKMTPLGLKAPTIVCFQTMSLPFQSGPITFDANFFPPSQTIDDTLMEATQAALLQLLPSEKTRNFVLKDAIKDLRGAGATIVTSRIEEAEPSLYWYYASAEPRRKGKDLLASVVQTLLARD
jgi:hypothetical protein